MPPGRVAELADAKDLGSFGAILAGSTPVAPTNQLDGMARRKGASLPLDNSLRRRNTAAPMATNSDAPLDLLWKEYGVGFAEFDDLTLGRWLVQTLGQLTGKVWRFSHPLVGSYRLAAQLAHDRQIWLKRLVTFPPAYSESACCRAPMLPLLTRDVRDAGLICLHCSETLVPFEETPPALQSELAGWAGQYASVHAVAHLDDRQRKTVGDYDRAYEAAATEAERLLAQAGTQLASRLLEFYAAVVWEDQDECLEVRPEDVRL